MSDSYIVQSALNTIDVNYKNIAANGSSATNSDQIIQDAGSSYTSQESLTEQTIKISSDSANDTASGTGARTVLLTGYDTNYNEQTEVITLNGQTAVNTVNKYILVRQIEVLTAGSGGTNAGAIYAGVGTVTAGVPQSQYLKVIAGNGTSRTGFYLVPAGYTAVLDRAVINNRTASNKCTLKLWAKKYGAVYVQKFVKDVEGNSTDHLDIKYPLPEKTLIKITGNNGTSTSSISIAISFRLIKN